MYMTMTWRSNGTPYALFVTWGRFWTFPLGRRKLVKLIFASGWYIFMIVWRCRGIVDAPRIFHIGVSWNWVCLPTTSHRPFPRGCLWQRRYVCIGIMLHCQHFSRTSKSRLADESPRWKLCKQTFRRLGSVTEDNEGFALFDLFGLVAWFAYCGGCQCRSCPVSQRSHVFSCPFSLHSIAWWGGRRKS